MPRFATPLATLIAAATLGGCGAPQDNRSDGLALEPCRLRGASGLTSVAAECGRLVVPENPAEPDGPAIELFVARIAALDPRFPASAFTLLAGGPGQAATEFYADAAGYFAAIHRHHDIVLVDQRGTGASRPLDCRYDDDLALIEFTPALAAGAARDCLAGLDGDPRYYTTSVAVTDLDAVRSALGYATFDLYGASYGTRVAQHYMKRYPANVRTAILDGVVPAAAALGPDIAIDAQRALDAIFARCAGEAACRREFPDLPGVFDALQARLRQGPLELTLAEPLSGQPHEFAYDYNSFAGSVRLLSYAPTTAALLPLLLHEAATRDNWAPLAAQAQMTLDSIAEALSEGMHNAVACTEDVPFFTVDAALRDALADTYLGDLQLLSLQAVCDVWPAGVIDPGFHDPLRSDTPVLLLSGSADPVTPPANGERVAQHLPASLHLVAPGHGHGVLTRGCVAGIIAEFVRTADFAELDTDCIAVDRPAPFFTSFAGPEP